MPSDNPLTPTAPVATQPASPTTPAQADTPAWVPQLLTALETGHKQVTDAVSGWSQKVVTAVQPGAAPKPTPAPAADADPLRALASGQWDPIDQRVEAKIRDMVAPYLGAQANGAAAANETAARANIDAKFGAGSYDKHFKADIDAMFGDRIAERSIPDNFNRVVSLVQGQKFDELLAAKATVDKARSDAEAAAAAKARMNAPYLPGPGYVPVEANTLSDEHRAQLAQIRNATGRAPSEEEAAKLRDLLMSRGARGIKLTDLNEVFPAAK